MRFMSIKNGEVKKKNTLLQVSIIPALCLQVLQPIRQSMNGVIPTVCVKLFSMLLPNLDLLTLTKVISYSCYIDPGFTDAVQ